MFSNALDQYGNSVEADKAEDGRDYFCKHCRARMRVRHCLVRRDHFFVFKDQHRSRDCAEIEKEKEVVREPSLLNASQFLRRTMAVRSGAERSHAGERNQPAKSTKEVLPPKSLRQLMVCGVCQMPANTPIEGGVLSDLLLTYHSFAQHLPGNPSLGGRVLELQPDSAQGRCIRYLGYWKQQGKAYRMFFEHYVDENLDFDELADELFQEKICRYGRSIWKKPRYKRILVSGIWSAIDHSQCSKICGYCVNARTVCVGMQIADLVNRNQIYYSDLPDNQV